MDSVPRIELEMRVREAAIQIAQAYGKEGVKFFHSHFLTIAEEYADSYEHEKARMRSFEPLLRKG